MPQGAVALRAADTIGSVNATDSPAWLPAPVEATGETDDLRHAGLRATRQRRTVLQALQDRPDAVTAQELHRELVADGEGIGLTTVYRTLTALAEADLLDVFSRDGEQAFRRCTDVHHHHLVCEMCGTVEEISATEVEDWVGAVAQRHGYRVTGHRADIFGVCEACT